MPPKRRSVVSSARSRSNRDELHVAPFRLQTEQGTLRMGVDRFDELPMQSFQEELERHAVQNQFAGSLFPQQVEVRRQDAPIRKLVTADFNLRNPVRSVVDSFIDVGNQAFDEQMKYAITKVEREIMNKRDFRKVLETDFVFSAVSPAIDVMTTMIGQEVVPAPTAQEVKDIKERINRLDPTLLTDTRALIKILKSLDLMYEVFKVGRATYNNAVKWYKYIVAMLTKISRDYGLPDPTNYFSGGGGGGDGGDGAPPPPPPPPGTNAPNDFTAPPSTQTPSASDTASPTLETQDTASTGSATSPNVPPAPPTQIVDPVAPPSMSGVVTRGTSSFAPPPPPPMPAGTQSPVVQGEVIPSAIPFYVTVIEYLLLPTVGMYAMFKTYRTPAQVPVGAYGEEVEALAMQNAHSLLHNLIMSAPRVFFNSNFGRLLVQATGGVWFVMRHQFSKWAETLLERAVANVADGVPMLQGADIGGADFNALRAARQMLEDPRLTSNVRQAIEEFVRENVNQAVQDAGQQAVAGRQAQDVAIQEQQGMQNPEDQVTPIKNLQFNRMAENIRSFLERITRNVGRNEVAQPITILQALNLYLSTVESLVSQGNVQTSPSEQDALKSLIDYYNLISKRYNNIAVGASIDDRTMNALFFGGDVRGITELAQVLAGYLYQYVTVGLQDALFGRTDSLLSFIVGQMGNIQRAFNNGQTYTLVSKRMGDEAKPLP